MCDMIRGQVDSLAKELMNVQNDLIDKEKLLQTKAKKLKADKAAETKEKKNLEHRLKDMQ